MSDKVKYACEIIWIYVDYFAFLAFFLLLLFVSLKCFFCFFFQILKLILRAYFEDQRFIIMCHC